jgi:hypothetical protein
MRGGESSSRWLTPRVGPRRVSPRYEAALAEVGAGCGDSSCRTPCARGIYSPRWRGARPRERIGPLRRQQNVPQLEPVSGDAALFVVGLPGYLLRYVLLCVSEPISSTSERNRWGGCEPTDSSLGPTAPFRDSSGSQSPLHARVVTYNSQNSGQGVHVSPHSVGNFRGTASSTP